VSDSETYLKCACQSCAGHIEFPSHAAGTSIACPHCGAETILEFAPVKIAAPARKKRWVWVAAAVVLALAVAARWLLPAILRAKLEASGGTNGLAPVKSGGMASASGATNAGRPQTSAVVSLAPRPDPWHGLMAGEVALAKAENGELRYAVGVLSNESSRERFGVKVLINLFDEQDAKVGSATDYTQSIIPGKEWKFKALVMSRKAVRAEVVKVTEQQ
jgi:predicted RNA-binding Zn-ribbon protein involved in translation (DUF1610 family)